MDPNCSCSERRRVASLLTRAFRAVIGIVLIGMLTSFIIRYADRHDANAKSAILRRELENLKNRKPNKERTVKHYSPSEENSAQQACSVENSQCELPEREIRDAIRKELSLYHADKTGMPDFAMENLGGCVLTTRDTKTLQRSVFGIFSKPESDPNEILRPDATPGKCWAFEGTNGTAVIKLMSFVFITHVTLEHISPKMTPSGDIASAPKTFTLWGLEDSKDPFGKHKFGTFEYKRGNPPVQTFPVKHPVRRSFRVVEITFHDNHGNDKYTCVYRVRIHGKMDGADGKQASGKPPS